MEIQNKRCGNCGRYPFCNRTEGASCYCDKWIKRKILITTDSPLINKSNQRR